MTAGTTSNHPRFIRDMPPPGRYDRRDARKVSLSGRSGWADYTRRFSAAGAEPRAALRVVNNTSSRFDRPTFPAYPSRSVGPDYPLRGGPRMYTLLLMTAMSSSPQTAEFNGFFRDLFSFGGCQGSSCQGS